MSLWQLAVPHLTSPSVCKLDTYIDAASADTYVPSGAPNAPAGLPDGLFFRPLVCLLLWAQIP